MASYEVTVTHAVSVSPSLGGLQPEVEQDVSVTQTPFAQTPDVTHSVNVEQSIINPKIESISQSASIIQTIRPNIIQVEIIQYIVGIHVVDTSETVPIDPEIMSQEASTVQTVTYNVVYTRSVTQSISCGSHAVTLNRYTNTRDDRLFVYAPLEGF
jgi:hypothetical protein